MDDNTKTQLEAAAFRHLVHHLQTHTDVQNIDLMILADFCRNCLAKWYTAAAQDQNVQVDYEHAREYIYGMPYKEWQAKYQGEATPEQLAGLEKEEKAYNMIQQANYDALFSGVIGQDYEMLKLICPLMTEMSRLVGEAVRHYPASQDKLSIVELGGGTGITTLALLSARENSHIASIDNEPTMQNQAKQNLKAWHEKGLVTFYNQDALSALQAMPTASVDIVASAYTLHNFLNGYRQDVIRECFRILKPNGQFINGDRYAFDDISQHTRAIQEEVAGYFKVLVGINRLDLLEHWIIHLFSDESENHVMRETSVLQQMQDVGFTEIKLRHRMEVNALVTGVKPSE